MATFPTAEYEPRELTNLNGIVFDELDTKILFAEDYNLLAGEVVAIESYLLSLFLASDNFLKIKKSGIIIESENTPASSTATGEKGTICYDSNYIYVCVATDTWKRISLTSW